MPVEVLKALETLAHFCLEQDSCKDCPMREACEKMPCELDFLFD